MNKVQQLHEVVEQTYTTFTSQNIKLHKIYNIEIYEKKFSLYNI